MVLPMQNKVPEVTLGFWVIKILATTLGETGGDTVTMTMDLGYLTGTAIFLSALIVLVGIQIAAKKFYPGLYWTVIVASTTAGTTMADFATRSLGIGYTGGSLLLFACLMAVLAAWYWSQGSISVETVNTPKVEAFYWARHYVFSNVGDRAWRLDRRYGRSWIRRRGARLRRRVGGHCCALLLDGRVARPLVLGGVHSHSTARSDFG